MALRTAPEAEPHIRVLADIVANELISSVPEILYPGQTHIPFGDNIPSGLTQEQALKVVVARTARLSYDNFGKAFSLEEDCALHDRLAKAGHWSAFEHIATVPKAPMSPEEQLKLSGNLPGWIQLRKTFSQECRPFNLDAYCGDSHG